MLFQHGIFLESDSGDAMFDQSGIKFCQDFAEAVNAGGDNDVFCRRFLAMHYHFLSRAASSANIRTAAVFR